MKPSSVSNGISKLSGSSLRMILPSGNLTLFSDMSLKSATLVTPLSLHWDRDIVRCGEFDRFRVASVDMTNNTHARVAGEDAFKAAFGTIATVGDDNHSGMLREANPDTTTVVDRHPRCACGRVNQRIKQRPICDRVAAVDHSFGFAIR